MLKEPKIKEIEAVLQGINPCLKIGRCCYSDGRLITISVRFPLKGNKNTINKLLELGWELDSKEKVITDRSYGCRNQPDRYVMYQSMTLHLN